MNIQETYHQSKKSYLFNDSKKFNSLRHSILNNFNLSPQIKKNNESLKHLDPNVLNFFYKYKASNTDIAFKKNDENHFNLDVIDGKIQTVENKSFENIRFENISNKNNSIEEKFLQFQNYFDKDYILNLNSLMLNSGYEIYIGEGQEVKIYISNSISEKDLTLFQKNMITCSKNSKVTIIEESLTNKPSNSNIVNFIDLEENSNVVHLIFQKNSDEANIQSTSYTNCKYNSKYKQLVINFSKGSSRNHHYANLLGERSSVDFDGIFYATNDQFIDNKTQINHKVPNCVSTQRYKGVLTERAKASYLSKTFVEKIAQKTEAYQLSKGILLSNDSYFHSKPELKIYADDVKCSHGSTIGPIDRDLLFYLRSRGLNKKESTSLLIKSFFHDIISEIDNKSFEEKFNYHTNIWLKENNI